MSYDHFKKRPYPDNDGNKHDIEFLPCPFCGEMPHVMPKGNSYTKKRAVTVKCKGCRIERTDAALVQGFDWLYDVAAKIGTSELTPNTLINGERICLIERNLLIW